MIAILTILATIVLSLVVTRVATVALTVTGLSRESARFQARSAFTGVGFTTSEAEAVVAHPVRRRIILLLMLLGNAGLITILASFLLSFAGSEGPRQTLPRILMLLGGLFAIFLVARSQAFDRAFGRVAARFLKRFTDLDVRDYADLLQLSNGYGAIELSVQEDNWVVGKSLEEIALRDEGVAVLGIAHAEGGFVGVPRGDELVGVGDTLTLYGHRQRLHEVAERQAGEEGDLEHREAVLNRQREERS